MATKTRSRSFPIPEPRGEQQQAPEQEVATSAGATTAPEIGMTVATQFIDDGFEQAKRTAEEITDSVIHLSESPEPLDLAEHVREHLAPAADGYHQRHVDLRVEPALAEFLARLRLGLNERNVRLASGRHVTSGADAARWLLEQCHLAATIVVEVKE